MTPREFADAHGLSMEEAQLILEKRNRPTPDPNSRLALAKAVNAKALKKVGVQPVSAEGDELVQGYDPDADVGVREFYKTKGPNWPNPDAGHGAGDGFPGSDYQETERFGDWEEPP